MAESKTTFVVKGAYGEQAKSVIMGVTGTDEMAAFKTFLANHTEGLVRLASYASKTAYAGTPGEGSMTDRRGVAYFQDVATGFTKRFTVPAPKAADCEMVPGKEGGERLTDAFMALLGAAMEAATGKSLTPLYGVVIQKQ